MKNIYYSASANISTYLYMHDVKLGKFMKQRPPCKDCLKEVMCINLISKNLSPRSAWGIIQIRSCEDLRRFMKKNKKFKRTIHF